MPVNARVKEPRPPGPWVNADSCVCGAVYKDDAPRVSWQDGVIRFRLANGDQGFRSRGAVLWCLRVEKLETWYLEHEACDWRFYEGSPVLFMEDGSMVFHV